MAQFIARIVLDLDDITDEVLSLTDREISFHSRAPVAIAAAFSESELDEIYASSLEQYAS